MSTGSVEVYIVCTRPSFGFRRDFVDTLQYFIFLYLGLAEFKNFRRPSSTVLIVQVFINNFTSSIWLICLPKWIGFCNMLFLHIFLSNVWAETRETRQRFMSLSSDMLAVRILRFLEKGNFVTWLTFHPLSFLKDVYRFNKDCIALLLTF